jgi:hypothetical protein
MILAVGRIKKILEKIPRIQKIFITMTIVAGCLLFYGIGIATNFFAQPMFSMFFIISEETAHNLVVYIAIGAAIAMGALAFAIKFLKRPKSASFEIPIKPAIPMVQRPLKVDTAVNMKTFSKPEATIPEQKMKPIQTAQLTQNQKTEKVEEQPVQQAPKPEASQVINKDKLTCRSCKKEFSTPMLMLEYPNSIATLVSYCPYCFQSLGKAGTTYKK